jgi:hypothetical protein
MRGRVGTRSPLFAGAFVRAGFKRVVLWPNPGIEERCRPRTSGEARTGISDAVYELVSVFYHAAEGGQLYAKYIEDAERARRCKSLLGRR